MTSTRAAEIMCDAYAHTDPHEDEPTARVDTLRKGQRFRCISGRLWTFDRQHGANHGAYIAHDDYGQTDYFAGCATVTLLDE